MSSDQLNLTNNYKAISKQLKCKANDFLNCKKNANNLIDIIQSFEENLNKGLPVSSFLLTLEVIFTELLKRSEMLIVIKPLKPKDNSAETNYREWLQGRYRETLRLILICFDVKLQTDATQALVTCMKLLSIESKHPIEYVFEDTYYFPVARFRSILIKLLPMDRSSKHLIDRFKEHSEYLDIVYYTWKLLLGLTPKGPAALTDEFAHNYLELINAIPVNKDLEERSKLLCRSENVTAETFSYLTIKKCINKVWSCVALWEMKEESIHKQVLIVLLERVLPHLEKPVLLTDFLMDSLDVGGPISLLALQGVFTLIQRHNLTYPNIYEKLYSMFEPEIFHTKFKARLFYLADIFLSSTHLPESLVAAFVKRLARLTLMAPPQDIVIILYFIGNLMLRHPGLKRLIYHPYREEISRDPYIMEEREPTKSNALESSLWEIAALQSHVMPSIAQAARFIAKPLPVNEWDLSSVLEINENDIFDQELAKKSKQFALMFEKPQTMFLPKNDKIIQYWKLF